MSVSVRVPVIVIVGGGFGGLAAARALKGVPWTLAAFSLSRGFQLIGTLVIARLVPPREIGVVLTGLVVVNALNLLSDNGLSISLLMREKVDRRLADTVFTLMLGIAAACVVAAWAFAGPISRSSRRISNGGSTAPFVARARHSTYSCRPANTASCSRTAIS